MTANGLDDELAARLRDLATSLRWDNDASDGAAIADEILAAVWDRIGPSRREAFVDGVWIPVRGPPPYGVPTRDATLAWTMPNESDRLFDRDLRRVCKLAFDVGAIALMDPKQAATAAVKHAARADVLAERFAPAQPEAEPTPGWFPASWYCQTTKGQMNADMIAAAARRGHVERQKRPRQRYLYELASIRRYYPQYAELLNTTESDRV